MGELYREGNLIKAVTGVEKLVSKNEEASLDVFVEIPEKGRYTLRGKVSFEGKETEAKELAFGVGTSAALGGSDQKFIAGAGVVLALVAAGAVFIGFRARRETRLAEGTVARVQNSD
jgi:hypothetical protein